MNSKKTFYIIFSSLSFILTVMFYYDSRTFLSNSGEAAAVVINSFPDTTADSVNNFFSDSKHYTYSIEFKTSDGRKIISTLTASTPDRWTAGSIVNILYNKKNPESASVRYSWKIIYFYKALLFFCVSLLFDLAAFKAK